MKERERGLGVDDTAEELSQNKSLATGVLKNYCGSFTPKICDNTEKKTGMC